MIECILIKIKITIN